MAVIGAQQYPQSLVVPGRDSGEVGVVGVRDREVFTTFCCDSVF